MWSRCWPVYTAVLHFFPAASPLPFCPREIIVKKKKKNGRQFKGRFDAINQNISQRVETKKHTHLNI